MLTSKNTHTQTVLLQPLSIKDWEARVSVRIDGSGRLGELNGRLAAVDKVTESVHHVTAAMEQLKQQLGASASKPAAKYDDTVFVPPL